MVNAMVLAMSTGVLHMHKGVAISISEMWESMWQDAFCLVSHRMYKLNKDRVKKK